MPGEKIIQAGLAGSFDESTRAVEKAIEERKGRLADGDDLIIERVFRVGVANSAAGTPVAMPARETVIRVPRIEECEEVPVFAVERGDRLRTVEHPRSVHGQVSEFVRVQDVELVKLDGHLVHVTVLGRTSLGVDVAIQFEPGTIVRRF